MHKDQNSFQGGAVAMLAEWKRLGLQPPCNLANKANKDAMETLHKALYPESSEKPLTDDQMASLGSSSFGGVKLTALVCAFFFKHHLNKIIRRFLQTSKTRFGSHGEAAGKVLVHLELYRELLSHIKDKKKASSWTNIEANVDKALRDLPALTELCVMVLYQQAITHPYMAIVRAPEETALNAIDLGPLHDDVQAHGAALIEDPDLLLDFDTDCHIHGTLDGNQFTRPERGDVPHLREIFIAFLRGAQETWIYFSSKFAPGGVINGLSPSLRKHVYLNPTNDVNEGALSEFCARKCQKETLTITTHNGLSMHKRNETSKFVNTFFEAEDHVWVMREARKYQAEGHEKKWCREQAEFKIKMVAMKRERRAVCQEKERLKAVVVDATELVTNEEKLGKMTGKQMNLQIDKLRAIWGKKFKLPTKSLRLKNQMAALKESVKEHLRRLEEAGGKVPSDDPAEEVVLVVDAWHEEEDAEMEDV
ncbi:hypothetical protein C8F01DRAFT_1276776 [Mycena amicta]|nr:hypothetical protein C8F01DRAFT_1276776 [Mycena amicta]